MRLRRNETNSGVYYEIEYAGQEFPSGYKLYNIGNQRTTDFACQSPFSIPCGEAGQYGCAANEYARCGGGQVECYVDLTSCFAGCSLYAISASVCNADGSHAARVMVKNASSTEQANAMLAIGVTEAENTTGGNYCQLHRLRCEMYP